MSRLTALCCFALTALAVAQPVSVSPPTKLVAQLDFISPLGTVTGVGAVSAGAEGAWAAEIATDHPDPALNEAILVNGALAIREGDPVQSLGAATVRSFRLYGLRSGSPIWQAFMDGLPPASDSALLFGGAVLLRAGDELTIAGFGPGTSLIGIREARVAGDQLAVAVVVDDPAVFGSVEHAVIQARFDSAGLIAPSVVVRANDNLAPGQQVRNLLSSPASLSVDESGRTGFIANVEWSFTPRRWAVAEGLAVAMSGSPAPVPGAAWRLASQPAVGVNGQHAAVLGELEDGRNLIARGGIVALEGEIIGGISGPLTAISPIGPLAVDSLGGAFWWGTWDPADPNTDSALFRNDQAIVHEGVTEVGQQRIDHIETIPGSIAVSPSGEHVIFRARLDLSGATGAFMIEIDNCYADCDGSTLLDIFDFICFQDAFVAADPYADCTGEGVFDIFDFICFQDAFVAGCP